MHIRVRTDGLGEELVDECLRNFRVLVHPADERPDFAIREFVDAVPKQRFVLAQGGQGRGRVSLLHSQG